MDIAKLKELATKATPGIWRWWTSNSYMRLSAKGDGDVMYASRLHDGCSTINVKDEDAAFIEAAQPSAILDLIALVERQGVELAEARKAAAESAKAGTFQEAHALSKTVTVDTPKFRVILPPEAILGQTYGNVVRYIDAHTAQAVAQTAAKYEADILALYDRRREDGNAIAALREQLAAAQQHAQAAEGPRYIAEPNAFQTKILYAMYRAAQKGESIERMHFDVCSAIDAQRIADPRVTGNAQAAPQHDFAKLMMYPQEWDTAAYPTLESAMWEAISCAQIASAIDHERDAEQQVGAQAALSDEQIVGVLHSLGIDTNKSRYGFPELQVSATNVPQVRNVVERCNAILAASQQPAAAKECGNCFEGKSDMDHICRACGGVGIAAEPPTPPQEAAALDKEAVAKAIYALLPEYRGRCPDDYPWQDGGNSFMQELARDMARAALAAPAAQVAVQEDLQQAIDAVDGCMDMTVVEPEDAAAWQVVRKYIAASPSPVLPAAGDGTKPNTEDCEVCIGYGAYGDGPFTQKCIACNGNGKLPSTSQGEALSQDQIFQRGRQSAIEDYKDAYQYGRAAGIEEAAKVCDQQAEEPECPERAQYCAEAIRDLNKQEPT